MRSSTSAPVTEAAAEPHPPRTRVLSRLTWVPLLIYVTTRAVDMAIMVWASTHQAGSDVLGSVDARTYFTYSSHGTDPGLLDLSTNWDGEYYRLIATDGYGSPAGYTGEEGAAVAARSYSFPPGYPVLVGALMRLLHTDFALTAMIVSLLCGAVAVMCIHRLALPRVGELGAACLVALTCCWVSAPVLNIAHSEALSLALLAAILLALDRRRPWVAAALVIPLALTRLVTPPLAIVTVLLYATLWRRERETITRGEWAGAAATAVLSLVGVSAWTVLQSLLGITVATDRLASYDGSVAGGWVWGLAAIEPVLGAVPIALLLILAALTWLRRDTWGVVLGAWAVSYSVYVLAATPMVLGIIRYSLLAFPFGLLVVGRADGTSRAVVTRVALVCALGLVLQVLWIRYGLVIAGGSEPQIGL